jgi:isopenicillin N synthase-like dioxygenase
VEDPVTASRLPLISLDALGTDDQELVRLRDAMHEIGFFFLIAHSIPTELEDDILRASRELFDLPDSAKAQIDMRTSPHFRGFTRLGEEQTRGRQDWREQIDIGPERPAISRPTQPWDILEGPNQWPARLPELREISTRWQDEMSRISRRLLHALALALGQDKTVLDAAFAERPSTLLKLIHYPRAAEGAAGTCQGVGAHKDPGVLTLLWIEPGVGGLEVEHHGEWIRATPVPGALVVNIGELLEWATDGYLRATMHRVVSSASGASRISVPFFYNPSLNARIPHLQLPPALRAQAPGVEQDPDNPISDSFGFNLLKSRLRAHPDVAARHHPGLQASA